MWPNRKQRSLVYTCVILSVFTEAAAAQVSLFTSSYVNLEDEMRHSLDGTSQPKYPCFQAEFIHRDVKQTGKLSLFKTNIENPN